MVGQVGGEGQDLLHRLPLTFGHLVRSASRIHKGGVAPLQIATRCKLVDHLEVRGSKVRLSVMTETVGITQEVGDIGGKARHREGDARTVVRRLATRYGVVRVRPSRLDALRGALVDVPVGAEAIPVDAGGRCLVEGAGKVFVDNDRRTGGRGWLRRRLEVLGGDGDGTRPIDVGQPGPRRAGGRGHGIDAELTAGNGDGLLADVAAVDVCDNII